MIENLPMITGNIVVQRITWRRAWGHRCSWSWKSWFWSFKCLKTYFCVFRPLHPRTIGANKVFPGRPNTWFGGAQKRWHKFKLISRCLKCPFGSPHYCCWSFQIPSKYWRYFHSLRKLKCVPLLFVAALRTCSSKTPFF